MEKIRFGVIGLGMISQLMHLPNLKKIQEIDLVAICDSEYKKAEFIARKYEVEHVYANYNDLLARPDIDAVIIATPTHMHLEITIAAIKAGKHCLVEKPLARNAEEVQQILDELDKTDLKLMVGLNQRFRPDAIVLKSFIAGGEIGDIFFIKSGWLQKQMADSNWRSSKALSGGGVFLDLGIMLLDLSLWLLDYPIVSSVLAINFDKSHSGVEDFSTVVLQLETGQAITIESGWNFEVDKDLLYCNVYGKEGLARFNPLKFNKKIHGSLVNVTPEQIGTMEDITKRSYYNEIKHFVGAIKGHYPLMASGHESLYRMKLVEAIYNSAEIKQEVKLTSVN
jgi:predicted dehydrogenase